MERALSDLSGGRAVAPLRAVIPVAEHHGFLGVMPAYVSGALGAKLVTFFPNNRDVHTHHATIVLFRPQTGEPFVTMDGRLITEMRTAAVSAVATRALARPDAAVLAILGSGVQARSHLEALRLVRPLRDVRVWSPRNAPAFAARFGVRAAASAEEAVRGADIVVVATTSKTPVLKGAWLSEGAHVNAVGASRPDWRELDDEVLARSKVFVDSREACSRESGDVIAGGKIAAEIGAVVSGTAPGRVSPEEITLFKSVGVAVEDVVSADLVYRAAVRARIDRGLPLARMTHRRTGDRRHGQEDEMARYGKKASEKVEKAMHERKRGMLKSGKSGKKVTSRKQAIAIGLSEARRAGGKVPRKKSSSKKN
jgi:ornithine cyclodeaminase/alanine dehydrogenase-like protein (mu-crystallin family)